MKKVLIVVILACVSLLWWIFDHLITVDLFARQINYFLIKLGGQLLLITLALSIFNKGLRGVWIGATVGLTIFILGLFAKTEDILKQVKNIDRDNIVIAIDKAIIGNTIQGRVIGIPNKLLNHFKVVIYVYTNQYYIHPYTTTYLEPGSNIDNDGSWQISSVRHPGPCPKKILAAIVNSDFVPDSIYRGAQEDIIKWMECSSCISCNDTVVSPPPALPKELEIHVEDAGKNSISNVKIYSISGNAFDDQYTDNQGNKTILLKKGIKCKERIKFEKKGYLPVDTVVNICDNSILYITIKPE